jgi:hypothetical protein
MVEFSLNLLCKGDWHLLPATLDTLKAQQGSFEILLLDGSGKLEAQYPELKIVDVSGKKTAEMMNRGLELSRGTYIQFIEPGDRYLSPHSLSFLSDLLKKEGEVDLIYTNSLIQGEVCQEEIAVARSPFFRRSTLLEQGGFSRRLKFRPTFDLIYRLLKNPQVKTLFCPRILLDPTPQRPNFSYLFETWQILRRYHSFWQALKLTLNKSHIGSAFSTFIRDSFVQKR